MGENGLAKEHTCTSHGLRQKCGGGQRRGGGRDGKGRKRGGNRDIGNSVSNKNEVKHIGFVTLSFLHFFIGV